MSPLSTPTTVCSEPEHSQQNHNHFSMPREVHFVALILYSKKMHIQMSPYAPNMPFMASYFLI